jgi:hypothetical protein
MKTTAAWSGLALALVVGIAMSGPASARVAVGVSIGVAPPAARIERVVVRPGYAWSPGYWRWNGARHVWVGGVWLRAQPGRHFVPAGWIHVGPAWRFHRGYWR